MKRIALVTVVAMALAGCGVASGGRPATGDGRLGDGRLRLVMEPTYEVGERVEVRLHNGSDDTYVYNEFYQVCSLEFRDEEGRRFIVPPGTHCDIDSRKHLSPGETVTLFRWDLTECTKDEWGCVEEEPLEPGTYTISGEFESVGGAPPARVDATLEIVAA